MPVAFSTRDAPRGWGIAGAAFLLSALLLGGGGVEGLAQSALIESTGAAIALWLLTISLVAPTEEDQSRKGPILALLLGALLLIQLIPLPPGIWHSLPGRELEAESLSLIGRAGSWRPISLDPGATSRFLLSLALPLAIYLAVRRSTFRSVRLYLFALVAAGMISTIIGILQIGLDYPSLLTWFDAPSPGAGAGLFANPNHHATFLSIAMIAAALLAVTEKRRIWAKSAAWALIFFFALGIVSTGARGGIALLAIVVPACALLLHREQGAARPLLALCAVGLAVSLVAALYPESNRLALRESFAFIDDARADFLPDLLFVLRLFWPIGSGFGSFVEVFGANVDLDRLGPSFFNHAHNEPIEWLIEGGFLGALFLAALAFGIAMAWRRRMREGHGKTALAGAAMLLVLLIHSLFDYPLRTDAIAACAGLAIALATVPFSEKPPSLPAQRSLAWRSGGVILAIIAFVVAGWAATLRLSQWAARKGDATLALRLDPDIGPAAAMLAQGLLETDAAAARRFATLAIDHTPLLQSAVSVLARTQPAAEAQASWAAAAKLGWRDPATQLWAMRQGIANGEYRIAAERADALLRSGKTSPQFLSLLREFSVLPAFRNEFAKRVALDPSWRRALLAIPADAAATEKDGVLSLVNELAAQGRPVTPQDIAGLSAYFVAHKNYGAAWRVSQLALGGPSAGNLVVDPGFDRTSDAYRGVPLSFGAWSLRASGSASASIDSGTLLADTNGETKTSVAQQLLRLGDGDWTLKLRIASPPQTDDSFAIGLRCLMPAGSEESYALAHDGGGDVSVPVKLAPGCQFARIDVEALPGGVPDSIEVDELSIERPN